MEAELKYYWSLDGLSMRPVSDPSTPEFIREYAAQQIAIHEADEQFLAECGIAPLDTPEITVRIA